MDRRSRRVLSVAIAAGLLAGALFAGRGLQAKGMSRARATLEQETAASLDSVTVELAGAERRLEALVLEAAAEPGLIQLVDLSANLPAEHREQLSRTLADAFVNEAWWETYRKEAKTALFLGDQLAYAGDLEASPTLVALARRAADATDGRGVARWLVSADSAHLAAATRVTSRSGKDPRPATLALVAPAPLDAIAARSQVALALRSRAGGLRAAPPNHPGAARLAAALSDPSATPDVCCAVRPLDDDVTVGVFGGNPDAVLAHAEEEARSQQRTLLLGAGGLMLLALAFGFVPRRGESDAPAAPPAETPPLAPSATAQTHLASARATLEPPPPSQVATAPRLPTAPGLVTSQQPGVPLDSRYQVLDRLGQGGMGTVYVAILRSVEGFRRLVVVKRLNAEHADNTERVKQFIDEARLGAMLVHSNIVPVFDFGVDAQGYFIAQEYILGRDVERVVRASMEQLGRPLETGVVLYVAQEALKALSYAHTSTDSSGRATNLVHRDVSPNNLMLSARGELKLLDFGIVRSDERLSKTQEGGIKGNLYFMSPEQARGQPVDARSDLFSLGLVLFYAASGKRLYEDGTTYELLLRAATGPTPSDLERIDALGPPLAGLLRRALATERDQRFADAEGFARAVAEAGAAAGASSVQKLVQQLFSEELAAEQARFSEGGKT